MKFRREILLTAAQAAGLMIPASLANSAMMYVRTDAERGQFADEIDRFRLELNSISAAFEVQPAANLMPAILGLWANLDAFKGSRSHPRMQEFKARTAFYAGTLSSTMRQEKNGAQWFTVAHGYAILAENFGLKSLIHSREAIAGLYWGRNASRVSADASLAREYAREPQERGLALMAWSRVFGETTQSRSEVVETIESALACAMPNSGEAPRPDAWWTHQAEMMAALALSRYGGLMGAVEGYIASAIAGLPRNAVLLRAHAQLTMADAYTSDREYDEAATLALTTLRAVPSEHRQPVLLGRGYGIHDRIRRQAGRPVAAARLREGLKALSESNGWPSVTAPSNGTG